MKEQCAIEKGKWDDFKNNQLLHQERELLHQCNGAIKGDNEQQLEENRQKAIKTVKAKLWRNDTFACLTRNVGKPKNALSKLRVKKPNSNETYTCYKRGEMKSKLVEHNR